MTTIGRRRLKAEELVNRIRADAEECFQEAFLAVREGDIEQEGDDGNRTKRAELDSGRHAFVGRDVWYRFSFLIPPGFFDNDTLAESFAAVDPARFDQRRSASR
jgi:hypothetical protein